ncbi:MAG: endonuclease/exonuclease/phosphatase family protein [Pseudomonadota bacterium]|nr:endonuclease/exonuclease/phosphatase family protein [Pseudomonadota bacterium]
MQLSLATYNIHGCVGRGGRFDPGRIEAVLRELDADVVALQELRWNPDAALDQLREFGEHLGYHTAAGPTLLRGDGHYGNAVLTRLPIAELQLVDISQPGREPRGAIDVRLRLPQLPAATAALAPLRVIATHLGLSPAERRAQIQMLLARVGEPGEEPVVLMGDLNEWFAWGRPMRHLHRHFGDSDCASTWPAVKPVFALDRIWAHPRDCLLQVAPHRSALSRRASDHLPLRAILKL